MRILVTISVILMCTVASAQVKVLGKMLHYTTQKELKVSQVNVVNMDNDQRYSLVASNGKYKVKLENGSRYKVEYTKEGYYNKFLMIDTRGIPSGKSLSLYVDMDMVEIQPGLDGALFQKPMGIARYQPDYRQMGWDLDYSKKRFEEVNAAFEALSQKENSPKDDPGNTESDEPYVMPLKTPFQLTYKFRDRIDPEVFSAPIDGIDFKEALVSGMILSNLAMHADDDGSDKRIGLVREFDKVKEASFSTKSYQIRLADGAGKQDSIDQVLANMYFNYTESRTALGNEALLETGSFLEILYQVVNVYPSKANKELNSFLGTAPQYFETLISYQAIDASDAELSFYADFNKLKTILEKIEYKPGGEMVQSDMLQIPHYFDVTPEILKELKESLTQIRSNLL